MISFILSGNIHAEIIQSVLSLTGVIAASLFIYIGTKGDRKLKEKEAELKNSFELIANELPRLREENKSIFKDLELCHAEKHLLQKNIYRLEIALQKYGISIPNELEALKDNYE